MSMSIQDKILLLTEGYTTLTVQFQGSAKQYTYKVMMNEGVVAGDAVVVDSPSQGLVVVTVTEVHTYPHIDVNAGFKYQWIVQKIDTSNFKRRQEMELRLTQSLLDLERQKQRAQLATDLQTELGADRLQQILTWTKEGLQ